MGLRAVRFLSLLCVALALTPAMAHLLELPNKMTLSREEYLIVQQIYRGWALLGIVIFAALLSTLILALRVRHNRRIFALTLTALVCIAGSLVVFLPLPILPTRSPITGPTYRKIGLSCAASGNTRTRPARPCI